MMTMLRKNLQTKEQALIQHFLRSHNRHARHCTNGFISPKYITQIVDALALEQ